MSTRRRARRGAVYDRGYRPYDGPRGRRGAATFALYKASMRRALGHPAVVAPEGRPVRAARRSSRSPRSSTSASATSPATASSPERIEIITYREYVGVSAALLLFVALVAPDVMCPDRRQHVLPLMFARPLTGVDYVRRQARRDRDDPVRVLVPAAGRAVRRQHARERQRARLLHRPLSTCCGRCRSRCCSSPCTTPSVGVAISSLTDRRIVAGASVIGLVPRHVDRVGHPRRRHPS